LEQRQGRYRLLPESELNRSGTRFYRYLAREIPANKATFIPVELTRHTFSDLLPAISCVYPVYQSGPSGLLIFQIYAQSFFKIVEQEMPHGPSGTVMLVNADGYYLYHSAKKKDWNRLLASKQTDNLVADYGQQVASSILSSRTDSFHETNDQMVAHAPLFAGHGDMGSSYTILKSVPREEFLASVEMYKKLFIGLLGLFLLGSLLLSYVATRQFTGPVQKLRREAEVIARGHYHSRVDVHTYDEIEDLAQQFNIMAESLEQREEEIARHREELEEMVRLRTRELENEKGKLEAILDNVPSGFLLLDKEYRIRSASAALRQITGKSVETLLGQPCYEVMGDGTKCSNCPAVRSFRSGTMETQLMRRVRAGGEERYLEHVSVPLRKNGEVASVLEIITDVTERKRLQDQLIRSERLATTGEIAAVIAHEMRNSITSVRMILQLLSENEKIIDTDRESLDVALDSLGRMEGVVSDLLQLSRPTELDRRMENCNDILRDSIEFARHQMVLRQVGMEIDLAPDLPGLLLDSDHIREAIVNLILNASQALDGKGKICVRSRLTTLSKELRDLGDVGEVSPETGAVGVQEVVLRKGEGVVRIDVEDTGCGIPAENLPRVFDPFFTTNVDGTGLGLSFVKRVVNEHGGIVTVQSEVGRGSEFSIYLPA
ncbi:MAG: ATP-binding protein, partial [Fidelibacterota bacterium]